jgi:hypothetical protein
VEVIHDMAVSGSVAIYRRHLVAASLEFDTEDNSMRTLIGLLVIIYLISVGVALAPTIQANWSTAATLEFIGSVATEMPRALS